ncbi:MAG: DNA/RNA non-specific endonuclease [Gammaproteobacteria bacterium]|nr:DNA/RNA non-specific endonuclease [Gammaproteobacteria bacterium]
MQLWLKEVPSVSDLLGIEEIHEILWGVLPDNHCRPRINTWDRGHLMPANHHMSGSPDAFKDTFFVTNILPQNSRFNQSRGHGLKPKWSCGVE